VTYESIRGEIETEWEHDGDTFRLEVTVPVNATATVHVPTSDPRDVTEGGRPAGRADGVRLLEVRDGYAVYEVGSGTYRFRSEI
jgi:alpha-L-rhamnosidase